MNILLVAATALEMKTLQGYFHFKDTGFKADKNNVDLLITGVGMVATAFALGKKLAEKKYDLVVNAGIAGSFNRDLQIGDTVIVKQDTFFEFGAEDDAGFLSLKDLNLGEITYFPTYAFENEKINTWLADLKKVKAITVNKVHGKHKSIQKTISTLNPDIETMEGAAFFYACQQMKIPAIQVRSLSNYVEKRNQENWNIRLAVENINQLLISFLKIDFDEA